MLIRKPPPPFEVHLEQRGGLSYGPKAQKSIGSPLYKKNVDKKVLFRSKRTIADPQTYWLKNTLRPLIQDTLQSSSFLSDDLFDRKKLIAYYENFKNRKEHVNSSFLIRILLTEWWRKKVLISN